jgi:hypothetical protein
MNGFPSREQVERIKVWYPIGTHLLHLPLELFYPMAFLQMIRLDVEKLLNVSIMS